MPRLLDSMGRPSTGRPRCIRAARVTALVLGIAVTSGFGGNADTVSSRFTAAADGLLDSSPRTTPPLVAARARGHLAALQEKVTSESLAAERHPAARLAWLDAAFQSSGLAPGSTPEDARAATRAAIDLLAETAPDDRTARLDRIVTAVLAGEADVASLTPADLVARAFPTSPDAACDRLAGGDDDVRLAMLDRADDASRAAVVAAILAATSPAGDSVTAMIDGFDHDLAGIGPEVVLELRRRGAGAATLTYVTRHPESITLPGTRIAAIATIAEHDPDAAMELCGGESVLERLAANSQVAIRLGLARHHRDTDPDLARMQVELAGQLDDRLEAMLAIRADGDPDRTLEEVKSCRTLPPGRLVAALAAGRVERARAVEAVADLYRTGRFDLAYSLLVPNTTEPTRPADAWLPSRLAILSEAFARADASPDAWIPLLESVPRIAGVDAQIEALAAIERGLASVVPPDQDLPDPLRAVLSDVLVAIALRG